MKWLLYQLYQFWCMLTTDEYQLQRDAEKYDL